jgi:transcription elongation factor Elf1
VAIANVVDDTKTLTEDVLMSVVRQFSCEECNADGKISLKNDIHEYEEIVYCPVCGYDIKDDEDDEDSFDDD